ncbi:MAG: cupin domain-containing protein [Oscillospiraceae bacterium]|jgi:mannose-6-phosphate isomerase-like protein (cupin superfamily)
MKKIQLNECPMIGLPLYEMQQLFGASGDFSGMSISYITLLPGRRVPTSGTGVHTGDEYSFFLEGEVYTESGDYKGVCQAGEGTLIPRGERHWCENRTDRPCRLLCVMVE